MRKRRRVTALIVLTVAALAVAGIAVSSNGSTNDKTFE
jgi:hypothetical protein